MISQKAQKESLEISVKSLRRVKSKDLADEVGKRDWISRHFVQLLEGWLSDVSYGINEMDLASI